MGGFAAKRVARSPASESYGDEPSPMAAGRNVAVLRLCEIGACETYGVTAIRDAGNLINETTFLAQVHLFTKSPHGRPSLTPKIRDKLLRYKI